ncbi:MAG: HAMP domain-containing sensor histidine kinase [Patescibacteria group bacterium]
MTVIFSLWVFFDLVLWATDNSSFTMFFWSLEILIEPMIYGASVYFLYVFINKNDIKTLTKILLILPILPIIILLPTKLTLLGFDLTNCDRNAVEGFLSTYYTYFIEILYVSWIFVLSIVKYIKAVPEQKRQIFFITLGIILFLLSFSFGNIIGSFTDDWVVGQLGLFGMPIFAGFLAYMIVRFKTFNIKLLGAQALVFALGFLVLAVAFIRNIENVKLVIAFTLLFVLLLGRALIKSVRKEVMQREQLQILSEQLFDANEKLKGLDKLKTEFLSLASHQLRSPLTAMKGYSSMLMEGDFGEINPKAKEAVERIFQSTMNLTKIVEDFLNVSKIEAGGMKYEMGTFSLSEIARDMSKDLSITAGQKGLKLNFESDSDTDCTVNGDREKVRQVVLNFIDNSIKYTKEGTVNVSVKKVSGKVIFSVKDTGMGMTPEIKATLFQKFARGDGARMNTGGSGLGLYLAKEIIEAHKGTVDVESDGPGKGSNFHFELDTIK